MYLLIRGRRNDAERREEGRGVLPLLLKGMGRGCKEEGERGREGAARGVFHLVSEGCGEGGGATRRGS